MSYPYDGFDEYSADEAKAMYAAGDISADEARHLSSGSYDPDGRGHNCEYDSSGQKGYWNDDDRWVPVRDDD